LAIVGGETGDCIDPGPVKASTTPCTVQVSTFALHTLIAAAALHATDAVTSLSGTLSCITNGNSRQFAYLKSFGCRCCQQSAASPLLEVSISAFVRTCNRRQWSRCRKTKRAGPSLILPSCYSMSLLLERSPYRHKCCKAGSRHHSVTGPIRVAIKTTRPCTKPLRNNCWFGDRHGWLSIVS
jgi:hypothetical protein